VVPQETHLVFDYTALEVVLMGRYCRLGAFEVEGAADLASASKALAATGTLALAHRQFPTLSGGEKQRVIIASALAQLDHGQGSRDSGSLLILDEPTASLDLRYQLELAALLTRLNREHALTVLLSTHDLRFASQLCSDVVLLSKGRILSEGPPHAVLTAAAISRLYEVAEHAAATVLPT
jgi:iron complex transport system ATP-binding protein